MAIAAASIVVCAVLFALYGLVGPRAACGSDCGACARPCRRSESDDVES